MIVLCQCSDYFRTLAETRVGHHPLNPNPQPRQPRVILETASSRAERNAMVQMLKIMYFKNIHDIPSEIKDIRDIREAFGDVLSDVATARDIAMLCRIADRWQIKGECLSVIAMCISALGIKVLFPSEKTPADSEEDEAVLTWTSFLQVQSAYILLLSDVSVVVQNDAVRAFFKKMPINVLKAWINLDGLLASSENDVVAALHMWCAHDNNAARASTKDMYDILSCVRVQYLTKNYAMMLTSHPIWSRTSHGVVLNRMMTGFQYTQSPISKEKRIFRLGGKRNFENSRNKSGVIVWSPSAEQLSLEKYKSVRPGFPFLKSKSTFSAGVLFQAACFRVEQPEEHEHAGTELVQFGFMISHPDVTGHIRQLFSLIVDKTEFRITNASDHTLFNVPLLNRSEMFYANETLSLTSPIPLSAIHNFISDGQLHVQIFVQPRCFDSDFHAWLTTPSPHGSAATAATATATAAAAANDRAQAQAHVQPQRPVAAVIMADITTGAV